MYRRFRAALPAVCLILLGACGDDDAAEDGMRGASRALGTAEMAGEGDAPAFALVRGQDTLLVERYTLQGNRVSGIMRDPSGSRVEYETTHSTSGGERTMRVTLHPADPASGPPIVSMFTLRGDSVHLTNSVGDSAVRQADAIQPNALPYLSPSMGMMALVVQSARTLVGDSGQVPLLAASVSQPPVVVSPLVLWRGDTAWVIGNEQNQFRLVFSEGRLVGAENAPQQMRSIRLQGGIAASPSARPSARSETAPGTAP